MVTTMFALAMGMAQTAWAEPTEAFLQWDAVARSEEPLVVTDFEWVNTEPQTFGGRGHQNSPLRIKPTRGCFGNICGRLDGSVTLDVTSMRDECNERVLCGSAAGLGKLSMVVGGGFFGLAAILPESPEGSPESEGYVTPSRIESLATSGGIAVAGAGLYFSAVSAPKRNERRQVLLYASEYMNAVFRRAYVKNRESYFLLRKHYLACVNGSDAPLTVSVEDRAMARSRCDTYKKELGRTPMLERAFVEASEEVRRAIASWHGSPLIDRLASGDYLGFYQDRANLFLDSLPTPVAQDVCDRVRDATGGKAIADALLRKKLSAWASETCPGVE